MQHTEAQNENLSAFLPYRIDEWQKTGEDQYFKGEQLFDFINGGAELYLSYNYQQVIHRDYEATEHESIMVDFFDMGSSKDAFGVYSHTREKNDNIVGQGSQIFTGALIFWKDQYFISITSTSAEKTVQEAIVETAKKIANKIPQKGNRPEILKLLPCKTLTEHKYMYFHHPIWQNAYFFISNDNIFNINDSTDAVMAGFDKGYLLLIKYPLPKQAKKAYKKAKKKLSGNKTEQNHFLFKNKEYLIGVFGVASESIARQRYDIVIKKLTNHKP